MLFVGDDWAQDHHDVEIQDESGRRLAKARLPEGVVGMAGLHALLGEHLDPDADIAQVSVGIETDRGPWVRALVAAGYRVFAVNPLQASRFRQRHSVSGAKSDAADAHTLADMVRTDSHQLRQVAGDSELAEAIKVVARAHKTLECRPGPRATPSKAALPMNEVSTTIIPALQGDEVEAWLIGPDIGITVRNSAGAAGTALT